jgi:hypothetical protein
LSLIKEGLREEHWMVASVRELGALSGAIVGKGKGGVGTKLLYSYRTLSDSGTLIATNRAKMAQSV